MYQTGFGGISPAIKNLLLANIAVYLLQGLELVSSWVFGLVPIQIVDKFFFWQFFTYMFLHGSVGHIFFNMFALWMFGVELERRWGTQEFLKYYLLTGVIAGISIFIWNALSGAWGVPTIGASGAVFGILIAYALFFPERYVYFWGVLPIKVKYLVIGYGAIELLLLPGHSNLSHIGHLGGMVAGFFYLRNRYRREGIGYRFFQDFFKKKGPF